jgi:HEAT repeat protein
MEVRAALQDRVPFVRTNAAHALAALGDRDAVQQLLAQARSDEYAPAQAAAAAVARIDPIALAAAAAAERPPSHLLEAVDLEAIGA